ncbi:HAD-IC family P-type ATPase [Magnetospirillum sp. UT-4]|uniref:cation-translocating P-type ATPase n=1 Tax=Magnetospirillum sp. UT-4 TaxID=2681467 RepID=UPI00137E00DA|nr:HAD-IC family P-type ATPase [Magnetospirillum sp. UT-4]CAA7615082.1 putative cation-transporting ATPase F [Magnetospirillum sp. UT-4]
MASSAPNPPAWHALSTDEVHTRLDSGHAGLTGAEARRRLERDGPNRLPAARRRGPLVMLLAQFNNVLIHVLLAAGAVTAMLGHWVDAGVIFGVVIINAVIGFIQEGKAERAMEAIRGMLTPTAVVLRDEHKLEVPAEELVVGDVVLLQGGDKVPADLRLLHAKGLRILEAVLTGESLPADKSAHPVAAEAPLGDRQSMAYSGCLVAAGHGAGMVVATGAATEIGRISALLTEVATLTTPLLRQMAQFGRQLTAAILVVAAFTFAFGRWVHGFALDEMFLAAVGLAVAAIPEGLPAIMTITMAIGVQRMARRNAIIRRLPAVETLGSVGIICTDKTGTLTLNEMTVRSVETAAAVYAVEGEGYAPLGRLLRDGAAVAPADCPDAVELSRAAALCSDADLAERDGAWTVAGDPMEGALLALAGKLDVDWGLEAKRMPRLDLIPFEAENRLMATLNHDHHGHAFAVAKGAPERILALCNRQRRDGADEVLDLPRWHAATEAMAARGERVLAIALAAMPADQRVLALEDLEGGFTLLGMVGLIDPPRPEAVAAVHRCRAAGIAVKMITGDHAVTAAAIAGQLGLDSGKVATGADLDGLDEAALHEVTETTAVFARTSPEHKLRLVMSLQQAGQVVAMTGDGVNDAPALKRADVGVAMGARGTEAAKEAAEVVLADDNFASIAHAVEQGRIVYDNLRKAILFILPTNGGEALVMVAAVVLGLTLPITAKQILWINMITAVTLALALSFEAAERDVMRRPPRRSDEPLLSGFLAWRVTLVSVLLLAAVLATYLWEVRAGAPIEVARTVAVNTMVLGEVVYLLSVRRFLSPALSRDAVTGSRPALVSIAMVVAWQLLFTYAPPMQALFDSAPLGLDAWGRIALAGLAVFLAIEAEKLVLRRRAIS